jgi:endonuclease YncB( thermonuclease family)
MIPDAVPFPGLMRREVMVSPRRLLSVAAVVLLFVVGALDAQCGLGPRHRSYGRGHVLEVMAPNLLKVKLVDREKILHIRLLGVGSPRNRDRIKTLDRGVVAYIQKNGLWEESRKYVESLVHGKLVEIWTRKWDRVDDKNRLLAYILIPNGGYKPLDVNAEIIKKGLGLVTRDYVHVTFADYKRFEGEARKNRRGIWRGLSMDRYSLIGK